MMRYSATIEFLTNQGAAIVALFDSRGEWVCAGRVEAKIQSGLRAALYEEGYRVASLAAHTHGGMLDRYSVAS